MKKKILSLILLSILSFSLIACGKTNEEDKIEKEVSKKEKATTEELVTYLLDNELNHIVIDGNEYSFPNTMSYFVEQPIFNQYIDEYNPTYLDEKIVSPLDNEMLKSAHIDSANIGSLWVGNTTTNELAARDCMVQYIKWGITDNDAVREDGFSKISWTCGKVNNLNTQEEIIEIYGEPNAISKSDDGHWEQYRYNNNTLEIVLNFEFVDEELEDFSIYINTDRVQEIYDYINNSQQ